MMRTPRDPGFIIAIFIIFCMIFLAIVLDDARGQETFNYWELEIETNRDKIIDFCDSFYKDHTSHRYYCIMGNFYALNKINDYLFEYHNDADAIDKLLALMTEWEIGETVNFMAVDREFNVYLENR